MKLTSEMIDVLNRFRDSYQNFIAGVCDDPAASEASRYLEKVESILHVGAVEMLVHHHEVCADLLDHCFDANSREIIAGVIESRDSDQ